MPDAAAEGAPAPVPADPAPEIELAAEDPRWAEALGGEGALESLAREAAALALGAAGASGAGRSVSFLFSDDAALAALNGRFRGREAPTNVLSWPAFELRAEARGAPDGAPPDPLPDPSAGTEDGAADPWGEEAESLGDVALAWETVAREAQDQGAGLRGHALHLALHGVLHLLGYDHERDGDAALMEGLERAALVAAGHPDPYLADAERRAAPEATAEKARSDGL